MLTIIALIALCFGIFFLTKYFQEKKAKEERDRLAEEGGKKDFFVTAGVGFSILLAPGIFGLLIFFLLIAVIFGGCM